MLGWFPSPYPDELFYSLCARYAEVVRYSQKGLRLDIFGVDKFFSIHLPSNLGNFAENLPANRCLGIDKLIKKHTLFPYFTAFLDSARTQSVYKKMINSDEVNPFLKAGASSPYNKTNEFLKLCPECVKSELSFGNTPYWHRLHQLPGVKVCPLHLIFLQNSSVSIAPLKKTKSFVSASQALPTTELKIEKIDASNAVHQILVSIALDSARLLTRNESRYNGDELYKAYFSILVEKGFVYKSGNFHYSKFSDSINKKLPTDLIDLLNCPLEQHQRGWHSAMTGVLNNKYSNPPLRNLLLISALGLNSDEFFDVCRSVSLQNTPLQEIGVFVEGRFPCRNPVCEFSGKLVIESLKIKFDKHSKFPFKERFTCHYCGYSYSRPTDEFGKYFDETIFVSDFGQVWKTELGKLWNDSTINIADVKNRLGCGMDTLMVYAARLNLKFPRIEVDGRKCGIAKRFLDRASAANKKAADSLKKNCVD